MKYKIADINNIDEIILLLKEVIARLNSINLPLWNDELYTVYHIFDTTLNLKRTVLDPGNPPIFFMISDPSLSCSTVCC